MSNALFSNRAAAQTGSSKRLRAVVPSDSDDLPDGACRALHTGGGGALVVVDAEGTTVTLQAAPAQYHPIGVRRVLATGTEATGIVALY